MPVSSDVRPRWVVWASIAWLIGFLLLFYSFTLPNSQPQLSRVDVWLLLIDPPQSADAAKHSGWRYLPQRFDVMAVAAFIVCGAWVVGRLLMRALRVDARLTHLERCVFSTGLGLAAVSLLTLGCGLAGFLDRRLLGGLLVAALVGEAVIRGVGCGKFKIAGGPRTPNESSGRRNFEFSTPDPGERGGLKWVCLLIAVPFLLAIGLGAMLPSFDFDVKEYHLQGPKEYFQNGRVGFLPHNVYTSFPFLTEMLSLLGMVLRDDWSRGALAGKAVLASFAPLTALGLYAAGRRWFSGTAGCLAALIYLTTPWTYRISIIAYAEGGLSFYLFAALFAVMLGIQASVGRPSKAVASTGKDDDGLGRPSYVGDDGLGRPSYVFLLAGLFAGSAMACKYPGVVQVVVPLGAAAVGFPWFMRKESKPDAQAKERASHPSLARQASIPSNPSGGRWWKRCLRYGGAFALGTAITVGPWLLKNTVETGNPVYPLLWSVFDGRDWDAELNAKWRAAHSPDDYALSDVGVKLVDVVAQSDWQSPLLFAFAPLALLVGRIANPSDVKGRIGNPSYGRTAIWLWCYVAFLFAAWWLLTHRIDRFWVPMIPVVALLAGAGASWCAERAWAIAAAVCILVALVYNLKFITTPLCGYNEYLIDYKAAARQVEEFEPGISFLNRHLPQNAKVLCVGEAALFNARRPVIYNTVFDRSIFEEWCGRPVAGKPPADRPLRPAAEIRERLKAAGVTHVYVNWQEVLRYRRTYGYTKFVTPQRFAELVRTGVLGPPLTDDEHRAYIRWDALSLEDRREVERWGPALRKTRAFKRFEVFPVRSD